MIEATLILLGFLIAFVAYRLEQTLDAIHDELITLRKAVTGAKR